MSNREYWENRLNRDYSLGGVGWLGLGKNYNYWLYRVRREVFTRVLRDEKLDFKTARVLDIGSGTGFYINLWKEMGSKDITGIDITSVAVDNLKRTYPDCRFLKADVSNTDDLKTFPPGSFDVISAFDVLFHIVDDSEYSNAIRNLSMLLKPGGLLVFSDNFISGDTLRVSHQVCHTFDYINGVLGSNKLLAKRRLPMFYLMMNPVDQGHPFLRIFWLFLAALIHRSEWLGWLFGFLLFPFEIIILRFIASGPSTKIMLCRKSDGS